MMSMKKQRNKKLKAKSSTKKIEAGYDAVVIPGDHKEIESIVSLANLSNPNPKRVGLYTDNMSILLVGEGDFSFALSLSIHLGGRNLVATCYDDEAQLKEKYPGVLSNVAAIRKTGAKVLYSVDATNLDKDLTISKTRTFDAVVFNFPHLGGATEEDVCKNQLLIQQFLQSSRSCIGKEGFVYITMRSSSFYDRWNVVAQAKQCGFRLKRKKPFQAETYAHYQPQRTCPSSMRNEAPSTIGACTYIFKPESVLLDKQNQDQKLSSILPKKLKLDKLHCVTCGTSFSNQKRYNGHINSAKHAKRVRETRK